MQDDILRKKVLLLRKNMGRQEIDNLLFHFAKSGLKNFTLLDLAITDRIVESMKDRKILIRDSEMSSDAFKRDISTILHSENTCVSYLWTTKSEFCGLLALDKLPSVEIIVSLLTDEYFGGYLTIYFMDSNKRLDVDIDENPEFRNQWIYSYKYSG